MTPDIAIRAAAAVDGSGAPRYRADAGMRAAVVEALEASETGFPDSRATAHVTPDDARGRCVMGDASA